MVFYLATIVGAWGWPISLRLLYDGFVPPVPYRWVRPPITLAFGNRPPEPGTGLIALTASGSSPGTILTGDAQAGVIFPEDAIEEPSGESSVIVTITPLDPGGIAPVPSGLRFDGNAYRFDAVYAGSRRPLVLRKPATVVLRYPTGATDLLQLSGPRWSPLHASPIEIAFQIYVSTITLGVFVAAGPPTGGLSVSVLVYRGVTALLWAAVVLVVAGLIHDFLRHRQRRRRDGRQ